MSKKKFGITDLEILESVTVASYFNYINRIADALGIQLDAIQFQPNDINQKILE